MIRPQQYFTCVRAFFAFLETFISTPVLTPPHNLRPMLHSTASSSINARPVCPVCPDALPVASVRLEAGAHQWR
jgi:hypothetical protein